MKMLKVWVISINIWFDFFEKNIEILLVNGIRAIDFGGFLKHLCIV